MTWIILQPSPDVLSRLEETVEKPEYFSEQEGGSMSLHLIFFEYQSVSWDAYVEHLRMTLEPLVCFPSGRYLLRSKANIMSDRNSALL